MNFDSDMIRVQSPYFAPAVLFVAAILTLIVAALTNRGDMTSAVLVLVGFILLITGIFLLTIGALRDPLPVTLTELLPVQGTVNMATVLAELGVTSNTLFRYLPVTNASVQINPVTGGFIPQLPATAVFVTIGEWNGIQYPAIASSLLHRLKQTDRLNVPKHDPDMLATCLREVFCDTLEVAKTVTVTRSETAITVVFENFALPNTCTTMHAVSKKCCTMVGCPICSLAGCIIAESEGCDVMADDVDFAGSTLTSVFSFHAQL